MQTLLKYTEIRKRTRTKCTYIILLKYENMMIKARYLPGVKWYAYGFALNVIQCSALLSTSILAGYIAL